MHRAFRSSPPSPPGSLIARSNSLASTCTEAEGCDRNRVTMPTPNLATSSHVCCDAPINSSNACSTSSGNPASRSGRAPAADVTLLSRYRRSESNFCEGILKKVREGTSRKHEERLAQRPYLLLPLQLLRCRGTWVEPVTAICMLVCAPRCDTPCYIQH
jgi:hypothetical protein